MFASCRRRSRRGLLRVNGARELVPRMGQHILKEPVFLQEVQRRRLVHRRVDREAWAVRAVAWADPAGRLAATYPKCYRGFQLRRLLI